MLVMELTERFFNKVNKIPGGCWEWQGCLNGGGYGLFFINKKTICAHRFSYSLAKPLAPGRANPLDHLCRNRKCVNPDHLETVTHRENMVRASMYRLKKPRRLIGIRKVKNGKYVARAKYRGTLYHIGTFSTAKEANRAYQEFVKNK